jgi:hypothetical protein
MTDDVRSWFEEALLRNGIVFERDDEQDLRFAYQDYRLYVAFDALDSRFVQLAFPRFHMCESSEGHLLAAVAASRIHRKHKLAKLVIGADGTVSAVVDMIVTTQAAVDEWLPRALIAVMCAGLGFLQDVKAA